MVSVTSSCVYKLCSEFFFYSTSHIVAFIMWLIFLYHDDTTVFSVWSWIYMSFPFILFLLCKGKWSDELLFMDIMYECRSAPERKMIGKIWYVVVFFFALEIIHKKTWWNSSIIQSSINMGVVLSYISDLYADLCF